MFFRRTKAANGLDGNSYYTYRLVENQREGTKTRQKTVLNLGANWDVLFPNPTGRRLPNGWKRSSRDRSPALSSRNTLKVLHNPLLTGCGHGT